MSEKGRENKNGPNKSKVNSYWIYGVLIVSILIFNIFMYSNAKSPTTTLQTFKEMVKAGDVQDVEVVNSKIVNVFLKDESLSKYSDTKENKFANSTTPHYSFEIGSVETFDNMIRDLNADKVLVDPEYKTKESWLAPLLGWILPFAILIAIWVFIMRRAACPLHPRRRRYGSG